MSKTDGKEAKVRNRVNRKHNDDLTQNSSTKPGQDGDGSRNEAIRAGGKNRSTGDNYLRHGASGIGGILGQLREIKESHLAYVKGHEQRLEARLKEAKKHQLVTLEKIERLEKELTVLLEQEAAQTNTSDEEG